MVGAHLYLLQLNVNPKKECEPKLDAGEKIQEKWVSFEEFLQLARNKNFAVPTHLKFLMYEALLDQNKFDELKLMVER